MIKSLYINYITIIEKIYTRQHYLKMLLAENFALYKKRNRIEKVKWNENQLAEFNSFWKKHYGGISSRGHRLIESLNNHYDYKYMPDFLYATKVESKLNPFLYAKLYSDKALTEILYKDKSEANIPRTFLLNSGGIFYDQDRNILTNQEAKNILKKIERAVVKPTVGGNSGKGIVIGTFDKNGWNSDRSFNLYDLLDGRKDFIVQEIIKQSHNLNQLYGDSINTFRIITYLIEGEVKVAPISLRMGTNGNKVDNIHSGGLVIGVSDEGSLCKYAYQLGYSDNSVLFAEHPNTKTKFKNFKIDEVPQIINSARVLHGITPQIGIISWDYTLNDNNIPVLIEANYLGQSVWFTQIVNKKPIFGDDTEKILKLIK